MGRGRQESRARTACLERQTVDAVRHPVASGHHVRRQSRDRRRHRCAGPGERRAPAGSRPGDVVENAWAAARAGDTLLIDLGHAARLCAVRMSLAAIWSAYPRGIEVATSLDATEWSAPVFNGSAAGLTIRGALEDPQHIWMTILICPVAEARFIRLRLNAPRDAHAVVHPRAASAGAVREIHSRSSRLRGAHTRHHVPARPASQLPRCHRISAIRCSARRFSGGTPTSCGSPGRWWDGFCIFPTPGMLAFSDHPPRPEPARDAPSVARRESD